MTDYTALAERYIAAWNERDAEARAKAVAELWAENGSYTDPLAAVAGYDGIAAVIAGAQEMFPGFVFTLGGPVDGHHDTARFTWHLAPEGPRGLEGLQGTEGAELSSALKIPHAHLVIRKGHNPGIDSYSAFVEADGATKTGLAGYLKERGIERVFITGLATDFCVAWSALDARKAGFDVIVIEDACRGIDLNGSLAAAWKDMEAAGVERTHSAEIM